MSVTAPALTGSADLEALLHKHFGFTTFHPGQREPIEAVLSGRDAIVVMPTGAGKSLCYQLPALVMNGITLVVSPLISLMKDQVDGLTAQGVPATSLNSTLSAEEAATRMADLRRGTLRLVYVAPERFRNRGFQNLLADLEIALIAVDEAHCISQWGHDFRPDYIRLGEVVRTLPRARVLALTATATPEVREDIAKQLGLGHGGRAAPAVQVSGFRRGNLRLVVSHVSTHAEKMDRIAAILDDFPTGIIYCSTRKQVERVGVMLGDLRVRHTIYHAGLSDEQRHAAQDEFMDGTVPLVVATNAFGMGVDRSDLRAVIHWDVPGSIEAYYQEVGRAGRDGKLSHCELLYNYADVRTQQFFLDGSNPDPATILALWNEVRARLHDGPLSCTLEEWGEQLRATDNKITVHTCMGLFERCGLIGREIKAGTRCYTTALIPDAPLTRLKEMLPGLEEKRKRDLRKLDRMLRYTNTRQCRHDFILEYFGQKGGTGAACGHCDHCGFSNAPQPRPPTEEEWPLIQKLLSCIGRLGGQCSPATLVAVACGTQTRDITAQGLHQSPVFGLLAGESTRFLDALLGELIQAGTVTVSTTPATRASLTPRGRDVAWRRIGIELVWPPRERGGTPAAPTAPPRRNRVARDSRKSTTEANLDRVLSATEETLFEALKEWRKNESLHQGTPVYLIFSNKTLKALALLKPTTYAELERVPGVGPSKLEAYGDDLLRVIKST